MKYRIPIETIRRLFTTWWGLWIIFFIYTSSMAIIVQFILPHVFPEVFFAKGLFVPDTAAFHHIAAQKALEIAEKGWEVWELRPCGQYPAGVASIFYYLWKPEAYSMIPFNAVIHATAGCLVFFLLTSFMKNRLAAACGAILFIINPASLEWTAQIHRDGTYILGNLLILTAWLLLIKGVMQKKWQNISYAFILTFSGSFLIWAPRPYWNQVALVSCILCFALILFYWVLNFRKPFFSLSWLIVTVVTGCFMILAQLPFTNTPFTQDIKSQENIKRQEEAASSQMNLSLIEIEKEMIPMKESAAKAKAVAKAQESLALIEIEKEMVSMKESAAKAKIKAEDTTKVMSMTKAAATIKAEDTTKVMSMTKAAAMIKAEDTTKVMSMTKAAAMIKAEDTTKVMSMTKAAATIKAEDTTKVMSKSIAARLEKIHNDLSRRQTEQDAWYNALLAFTPESNLMTLKYKVKKMEVPEENYGRLSLADLEERFQALFQWEKELKERNMVLQQKRELMLEWVRTSFLPDFIENKLYSVWRYRTNVVRTGGNTVIDPYISLNSAGAFIPYFPRAL
ncbi:MAG: hypothetical protein KJ976_03040, partial [Proteobacteria bacterium]|nr:hypothetical protein [Pseudomonadota bacterium]